MGDQATQAATSAPADEAPQVILLYNGQDEVVAALVDGHVDEWVARALAHEREKVDGTDVEEVMDWGRARTEHSWWLEIDDEGPVDLAPAPGDGRTPVTVVTL